MPLYIGEMSPERRRQVVLFRCLKPLAESLAGFRLKAEPQVQHVA